MPARKPDLIAYTAEQMPKINAAVDFVNVSGECRDEGSVFWLTVCLTRSWHTTS